MMTISKVLYSHNRSGGREWLSEKQWQALRDANWCDEQYKSLSRFGLSECDAIDEWSKVTGANPYSQGCECCGPPHNFHESEDWSRYTHDCKSCVFLGEYHHLDDENEDNDKRYDLYWCQQAIGGPTVIARFGDEGQDYLSGMCFAENGSSAPLVEARKRAISLGLKVD